MHLKKAKRGERIYLSIVQNYREGGKTRTKTIESIGYADEFADAHPDPIAHFQEYVAELNERRKSQNPSVALTFALDAEIDPTHVSSARWGSALALAYLDALGVRDFFDAWAGHAGFPAHAGRIFEMLASERIIHVASKRESWERRASFPRPCDFSLSDAYQALGCFAAHSDGLVRAMDAAYRRIRGARRCDEAYAVFVPLASLGAGDAAPAGDSSERHAGGLIMVLDEDTLPISFILTSSRPRSDEFALAARNARRDAGARRTVLIAARVADAAATMTALSAQGDGFILLRPMREASTDLHAWIADTRGYIATQSGSYKVKTRTTRMQTEGGPDVRTKEIVLWGRDFARRSLKLSTHASERQGAPSVSDADPGGYLCIVTSETQRTEAVVFHLYREVWRLAEPFQVLESDFSPLPYPVPRRTHIEAHCLICYAAFFALRTLRADMEWRYNAAQVADALLRMEGAYLDENWFLFSYRSEVTDAVEKAAGVDVARRLRTPPGIRRDIARARKHIERNADRASRPGTAKETTMGQDDKG